MADPTCIECGESFLWNEDADTDDDAALCNNCAQAQASAMRPFVAPERVRPEDLKNNALVIPRGSIRCAQWEEDESLVRLGISLGDDAGNIWLTVSRSELGYHSAAHAAHHRTQSWPVPVEPAALSPGEQLVWAAAFARGVDGGSSPASAARHATHRVQQLREVTADEVAGLGRMGAPLTVLAAVEQMRGGR